MYIPKLFHEKDEAIVLDFLRRYSFGTLTCMVDGQFWSVHLPFTISPQEHGFRLQGHLARANKLSQVLATAPLLVNFLGPNSYVSPNWYADNKHYPTWIYAAVQVRGRARILHDDELDAQLRQLIAEQECAKGDGPGWDLSLMPESLTAQFKQMVVGFDITIEHIEPCFKLNQHKRREDIDAMVHSLHSRGEPARALAQIAAQASERSSGDEIARYLHKYTPKD